MTSPKKQKSVKASPGKPPLFRFYVADEVRREVNNKLSLLGLYPDGTVIAIATKDQIQANKQDKDQYGFQIERLAFLINVSNLSGTPTIQFFYPSGRPYGEVSVLEPITAEKSSHTIVLEAKPFHFNELGTYEVHFELNNVKEKFTFNMQVTDKMPA